MPNDLTTTRDRWIDDLRALRDAPALRMSLAGGAARQRDYTRLWQGLCDCAGPQPSASNARADEHRAGCPYRVEVDGESGGGVR